LDPLRGLVERYLAAGIKGFVLSSGTGMHVYLSKEESKELAQRGSRIINGRAKIIVQTSALLPHEQEGEELRCPPDFRDGSPERLAGRLSFTPRGV
jgi:hypothetical protein